MRGELRPKILSGAKSILHGMVDAIYPRTCPFCDKILARGTDICGDCQNKLKYVVEPRCKKCGKQLIKEEQEYCYDCTKLRHLYREGIATFAYDEMVSKSIYRFKYYNRRTYAGMYARAIGVRYGEYIARWQPDVLVPVPIHRAKLQKRGYNQAELIAVELGKQLGIPVDSKILQRVRHTRAQKELNRSERKKNLENAFKISSYVVKYKKIVLVDDIYTTGSTIDECTKVLMAAGAQDVYFVSLSIGAGI